jgi:glycosyltransferase involved in cell wall biosynthesis
MGDGEAMETQRDWLKGRAVSVVIPTLNEAPNLPYVIPQIPTWVHEVVLVDGRSTDDTVGTARGLWPNYHIVMKERRRRQVPLPEAQQERRQRGITLRVVTQERRGKGAALQAGFAAATGDIIVMLDADGSTAPQEIAAFVGALLAGADFAKGSRFLRGAGTADMPFYRKVGNWSFVVLVRCLFGGRFTDLCYGYNAFWAWTVPLLRLDGDGFEIETMMNLRALQLGLKITEVSSFEAERIYGVGRLRTIPDGWRVLKTIIREWWSPRVRPLMPEQLRHVAGEYQRAPGTPQVPAGVKQFSEWDGPLDAPLMEAQ